MIPQQTNVIQAFQKSKVKNSKSLRFVANPSEKKNINYVISDIIEYVIGQYVTIRYGMMIKTGLHA